MLLYLYLICSHIVTLSSSTVILQVFNIRSRDISQLQDLIYTSEITKWCEDYLDEQNVEGS